MVNREPPLGPLRVCPTPEPTQLLPSESGSAPLLAGGRVPPPSLPQAQAPPPSHSVAGRLACSSGRTLHHPLPPASSPTQCPRHPCTLRTEARVLREAADNSECPEHPQSEPRPRRSTPLTQGPQLGRGRSGSAATRHGPARRDRQPSGRLRAKRARGQARRTARFAGAITDRASGARLGPKAGLDARRPGLRGAPGRAGGGRGRGGGIPRRRRPAHPLACTPP